MNNLQTTWNLTSLFSGDSDPLIETEKENLQKAADQFATKWEKRADWLENAESLLQILTDYQNWLTNSGFYGKTGYYFFLRTSQDSIDPILKAKSNQIDEISTKIANQMQFVELRISKIEKIKQQEFLQSKELLEFRHFLERIFVNSQYLLSESEEKIVNLLSFHKGNWSDMVEEFLNSEKIELDLEKVENSDLESQNLIQNSDESSEITLDLEKLKEKYSFIQEKAKKDGIAKLCVNPVILQNGKVLITKRCGDNPRRPNLWCLAGGKADENENIIETLIRETKDELGLEITKIEKYLPIEWDSLVPLSWDISSQNRKWRVVYFVVKAVGEIKLEEQELSEYKFISQEEIPKYFTAEELDPNSELYRGGEFQVWEEIKKLNLNQNNLENEILTFGQKDELVNDFEKTDIFVIYNAQTGLFTHQYNLESWRNYDDLLWFENELDLQKKLETGAEDYQIYDLNPKIINYTNYCNFEYSPKLLIIKSQQNQEKLIWESKTEILAKFENLVQKDSENSSKICLLILQKGIAKLAELGFETEKQDLGNEKTSNLEIKNGISKNLEKLESEKSELLVATHNPNKVKRYQKQLADLPVKLISLADLDLKIETPIEIGNSTLEIVKNKAKFYFDQTQMPCFSNDSGLFFEGVEDFEQPKTDVKGIVGIRGETNQEEIYVKMIEFYQNLATKYGGELKGYFLDSYALFDGENYFVKEVKRPILLTNKVNQKDIHFPICSLYKVKGKFYHDLNEAEMSEFLAESINGLKEIIRNWQKTQNLNSEKLDSKNLKNNNLRIESDNLENDNLEETGKIEITFEELMTKLSDPNQEIRDKSVVKFDQIMEKYKPIATHELNAILRHKQVIDELRGYQSPDSARLASDDVDPQIVKTLLESVRSRFEISHNYYKLKAKLMGKEQLKYHERNVEYGKIIQSYSFEEAVVILRRVFAKLDGQLDNNSQNLEKKSKITKPIKAILFDLDGVLIQTFFEGQKTFAHSLLLEKKYNIKPEQTQEFWQKAFPDCVIGKADLKEILPEFLNKWNYPNSVDEYLKEWLKSEDNFYQAHLNLAKKLKSQGFKICIVTNQEKYKTDWLKQHYDQDFDGIFSSSDLKVTKKDSNFWQKVGESLCLEFDEMLLIDDSQENVEITRNLGMQTILFDENVDLGEKINEKLNLEFSLENKSENRNIKNIGKKVIKNLIFDFWGVLFFEDTDKFAEEISNKITDGKQKLPKIKSMMKELIKLARKEESVENWVKEFEEFTGQKAHSKSVWGDNFYVNEMISNFIKKNQEKYNFYYLTNIDSDIFKKCQKAEIMKYFVGGIASCDVNVRKPNREIYQKLLQKYNLKAEESVFIDDKLENIQTAQNLGFETILFDENVDLEKEIKQKFDFTDLENKTKNSKEISQIKTLLIDAIDCIITKNSQNELFLNQELFDFLKDQNQRKIVVTNATGETLTKIKELLNNKNFEVWTLEFEPEKTKPEYFEIILKSLNLKNEECFYFDHSHKNLESAKKVGINGILYQNNQQIIGELENILSGILEQKYNLSFEDYLALKIENPSENLVLRSLKITDAQEILSQNTGNVVEYFMKFTNLENVENWITKVLEEIKNQEKLELVIEKSGKLVGMLSLRNLQTKPEFGLWIGENWQKMGIVKNSMTTFIDWIWINTAFEKLFYTRIDSQNIGSQNLVKSLQAEQIGQFDFVFYKNSNSQKEILEIQAQSSQKIPENSFLAILDDYLTNGKIDVYPRTGKRGGAFMTGNTGRIIDPTFIFLNWTNTLNDVQTFAHEMGHACNYEMMKKTNKALTWDGSYLTMESPSTFMEDFILEDILENCTNKEEKLSILMKKLNDDVSSIFRQISLYLFELELHSEFRAKGYLSGTEIGELFSKHMANYMGNAVEKSEGSKNWWIYWSHIRYMFYVYSYGAGLLISKSMQKRLKDNPQFITNIKEFYAAGMDKTPIETLAEKLQIDATKPDIWLEGLEQTSKNLEMVEKLATELGLIK